MACPASGKTTSASTPFATMPWMSAMAFCVSPWPSAYSKEVTLGHLLASSLAEAVVTRRQLLPPKPSVIPRTASSGPHHEGTSPFAAAPLEEAWSPPPPPPQAARARTPTQVSVRGLVRESSRFTGRFLSGSWVGRGRCLGVRVSRGRAGGRRLPGEAVPEGDP